MSNCIICGQEIDKECEEHIIPYALGNKHFIIRSVCKTCNSLMGDKFDAKNTDSLIAKFMRLQHGIKGRSKKLPNPFEEGETSDGSRIRLSLDFKPKLVPKVTRDGNNYHVSASSKEEAIDIVEKIYSRNGKGALTEEQKEKLCAQMKSTKTHPEIQFHFEFNIEKFYLELVKIAFETLYYQEGDKILLEESIVNLQKILHDYIYKEQYDEDLIKGIIGLPPENADKDMSENLLVFKRQFNEEVVHLVYVLSEHNELTVLSIVEGMLNGAVKIPVKDSNSYKSKMYFICYPSGNIIVN